MKVYKILHKPSGLYFTPSAGSGNLSLTGKIYSRKPSLLVCIGGIIRIVIYARDKDKLSKRNQIILNNFKIPKKDTWVHGTTLHIDTLVNTAYEDWEIIEL